MCNDGLFSSNSFMQGHKKLLCRKRKILGKDSESSCRTSGPSVRMFAGKLGSWTLIFQGTLFFLSWKLRRASPSGRAKSLLWLDC